MSVSSKGVERNPSCTFEGHKYTRGRDCWRLAGRHHDNALRSSRREHLLGQGEAQRANAVARVKGARPFRVRMADCIAGEDHE